MWRPCRWRALDVDPVIQRNVAFVGRSGEAAWRELRRALVPLKLGWLRRLASHELVGERPDRRPEERRGDVEPEFERHLRRLTAGERSTIALPRSRDRTSVRLCANLPDPMAKLQDLQTQIPGSELFGLSVASPVSLFS